MLRFHIGPLHAHGRPVQPRFGEELAQLGATDDGEPDEDSRVAVEVWRREVYAWPRAQQGFLGVEVGYPCAKDVAGGCALAQGLEVGSPERPLPREEFALDTPLSRRRLRSLR